MRKFKPGHSLVWGKKELRSRRDVKIGGSLAARCGRLRTVRLGSTHFVGEKKLWSSVGGQSGLWGAPCLTLASEVLGQFLFCLLLRIVSVCSLCTRRAAFSPILTLTATAWDPTISRSRWTVPTVPEWPTTNATAPCAWWTIRVRLRRWLAWGCRGAAGQGLGCPVSPGVSRLPQGHACLCPPRISCPAVKVSAAWGPSLLLSILYVLLRVPTSDFTCCPSDSQRHGERSFTLAVGRVSCNLWSRFFFFFFN